MSAVPPPGGVGIPSLVVSCPKPEMSNPTNYLTEALETAEKKNRLSES